ncbi:capsule assembly Wzi family protein [Geobacter sp. OR-1]|uniref:capsule assembly Wzi family protein n=1 Tax=Geobacter sp. OR-1 TaxID=1266765 RepID=UPI001269AB18|nr:capsule assembly Wzi family protein [Geobacter sp. OR-1]
MALTLGLIGQTVFASSCIAASSPNIPLDSPLYLYLEKLAGFGLITSDVKGLKPFSRAEAARLLLEAESRLPGSSNAPVMVADLIRRVRELVPREIFLFGNPQNRPALFDYDPMAGLRLRMVSLDGLPRDYNRVTWDKAHQSAFGFIGGDLRPLGNGAPVRTTGTEGTPLLENNEGVVFRDGSNLSVNWSAVGYLSDVAVLNLEPLALHTPDSDSLRIAKGYLKIGGGGIELEVGRDANWFGPGYRGALTLTNNAKNFDMVKISSPEPVDVDWVKKYLGALKYAFIVSRFDETGSGQDYRRPWFFGLKVALKPADWLEIGANMVRQEGGPGFSGSVSLKDMIIGGGDNDHINAIAGLDLRVRIPRLRNAELYGEFSGEDSAGPWPIVESYVAGLFLPDLFGNGRDDFRFEYYWASVIAYGDWQFPQGYVYNNMTPGHSQGGGSAQEFFFRYSHWFSVRNTLAVEYFHTQRGIVGKMPGQVEEQKNAFRAFWRLPLYGEWDAGLMYGWERINNLNLVSGARRSNQLFGLDLSYRY